jgi:hypothetical protein
MMRRLLISLCAGLVLVGTLWLCELSNPSSVVTTLILNVVYVPTHRLCSVVYPPDPSRTWESNTYMGVVAGISVFTNAAFVYVVWGIVRRWKGARKQRQQTKG